jgi:SpoVK/Ycf46/Vps4 family AAA+-type ATPase
MAGAKDISQLGGQLQREWKKLQLAVVEPLKGAASAAAYEVRGGGAPPFPDDAAAAAAAAAVSPDSERKGETNNPEPSPSTTVVVGAVAAMGATERQEEAGGCQQGQRTEEKDVVDGAEEKEEAATTAALLRALGVGSPRGVLISGPPGTGKTALALSLARACAPFGVRFLSVSCNALVKAEVGSSEKALAEVFAAARRAAPCLVLLDQVEVIAGCRKVPAAGGGDSSSSSSTENTMDRLLSLLLVEVDGVLTGTGGSGGGGDGSFMSMGGLSGGGGGGGAGSRNDGSGDATVVLIATTQDASAVEPALLRPGRLDQHVHLSDRPDRADRADILNRLLTQIPLDLDDRPHYGGKHLPPIYPPSQDAHEGGGLEGAVCEPESRRDTPVETTEKGGSEAFVSWLAEATEGLSAAALESLCQEAAIECLRHDIRSLGVRQQHFKVALGAH